MKGDLNKHYISFYVKDPRAAAKLKELADQLGISVSSLVSQIVRQVLSFVEDVRVEGGLGYIYLRYAPPYLIIDRRAGRVVEGKKNSTGGGSGAPGPEAQREEEKEEWRAVESDSDTAENAAEEPEGERDSSILGIKVGPGGCVRIVVGKFMIIGTIVLRNEDSIVVEDLWGRRHAARIAKISLISEMPCNMLDEIREQIELRRTQRRKRPRREEEGGKGSGG